MERQINLLRATRGNFARIIDALDKEQLVRIPDGFRNNVLWNIGHALTTCDLLVYGRAGLPMRLEKSFIEHFRKGTAPDGTELDHLAFIVRELVDGAEDLEKQISSNPVPDYDPYMTSYNFQLDSWEDAIQFNNAHEALHLGYVMAMIKRL